MDHGGLAGGHSTMSVGGWIMGTGTAVKRKKSKRFFQKGVGGSVLTGGGGQRKPRRA